MIARLFLALAALFLASPALAQTYPPLTGRVTDAADLLNPAQEAELTQKLAALEAATTRQLVVATVPSLEGHDIQEYGVGLGRAWHIGQQGANNGVILLVAPNERKVGIQVGYGMEGVLTDALSGQIVRNDILPHMRDNDYPGGIAAGTDALIAQLQAPPEAAEANLQRAATAEQQDRQATHRRHRGSSIGSFVVWGGIFLFILMPALGAGLGGRRYRRGRHNVSIWGPGQGYGRGGGSGLGWMLMGMALSNMNRRGGDWGGGGSSWGGGGGSSWGGGGGGGGFSGGGGSFGGGGASGGW